MATSKKQPQHIESGFKPKQGIRRVGVQEFPRKHVGIICHAYKLVWVRTKGNEPKANRRQAMSKHWASEFYQMFAEWY